MKIAEKAKAAARATDDYVHDNPWQAIGIAAAIGLAGLAARAAFQATTAMPPM